MHSLLPIIRDSRVLSTEIQRTRALARIIHETRE